MLQICIRAFEVQNKLPKQTQRTSNRHEKELTSGNYRLTSAQPVVSAKWRVIWHNTQFISRQRDLLFVIVVLVLKNKW